MGENVVDPFDFAQDRFLLVFGCFLAFFAENCSIFTVFIDLCRMVIWNRSKRSLAGHLFAMYMTVIRMVIDAQEILAVRKPAFSANRRSF